MLSQSQHHRNRQQSSCSSFRVLRGPRAGSLTWRHIVGCSQSCPEGCLGQCWRGRRRRPAPPRGSQAGVWRCAVGRGSVTVVLSMGRLQHKSALIPHRDHSLVVNVQPAQDVWASSSVASPGMKGHDGHSSLPSCQA